MTTLTHRRQDKDLNTGYVHLFAEAGNDHYGDHVWALGTELPPIPEALILWTANYYGIDIDDALETANPSNIVSSANAWDDPQFVSDVWQAMEYGELEMVAGYRTEDGAIVLDLDWVALTYSRDE